jgi:hypothetical protein
VNPTPAGIRRGCLPERIRGRSRSPHVLSDAKWRSSPLFSIGFFQKVDSTFQSDALRAGF